VAALVAAVAAAGNYGPSLKSPDVTSDKTGINQI
jgi:hypothetical protein